MEMPGRKFALGNAYRYGFNGQEKSDEIFEGSTTALFWEYDSRIGRRWNIDPVVKEFESPYATFSGNPIFFSDVLGNDPGDPKLKQQSPKQEKLNENQVSAAIWSAIFSIHTNTMYKRAYYTTSTTPENKVPYLGNDLYNEASAKTLSVYDIKPTQLYDFVNTYKHYYEEFASIGMWSKEGKAVEELYKAMENASPDDRTKIANGFIKDFGAKSEKWQELSKAGVTFGNILLMYGGQEVQVPKGIKAPFKSTTNATANTGTNVYNHSFKYADRVRMRGVQDPVSHNFPYSFDDAILATKPILKKDGYQMFQLKGTMNGKNGVFEIGLTKDGIIDHRFFRPIK